MIKMIKILIVFAIMLLLAVPVTAANVTTVEIRGLFLAPFKYLTKLYRGCW